MRQIMQPPKAVQDSLYPIRVALLQRKQQMDEKVRRQQIEPRENLAGQLSTGTGNLIKVLFLGNDELKQNYMQSTKSDTASYIGTIGIGFETVEVKGNKMQMWDTAGQARFSIVTSSYLRGAHILIIFAKDQQDFDQFRNQLIDNKTVLDNNILMILVKPGDKNIEFEPLPFTGVLEIDGKFNLQQLAESTFAAINQYAESVPGLFERIKKARQAQAEDNDREIQVVKNFINDTQFWNNITGNITKSFPDTVVAMQKLFENNKIPNLDDLKQLANKRILEVEASEKSTFSFLSSKPNPTTLAFYKCVRDATDFKSIITWIVQKKTELSPPAAPSAPASRKT